ncbi:outer envelope pore protein 16-2, chloroplastic-like [Chenopodium quinoa]|uniref:outer envelope pore protein 16-2, chloroplastic-like n=1 Tax=Chenopodium quinoa TaxID=63459 RepID=UPI000B77B49A|nr:outer envelope pore protein 16-2, chloroplastic-like [Chenopodium quinoa]
MSSVTVTATTRPANSSIDNLGKRSVMDELRSFEKEGYFDLGHPLLNRIAHSFIKAAGIGALQAVSREAYFTVVEGVGIDSTDGNGAKKKIPDLRGETNRKSIEALVKSTGKESFQWGLAAGVFSGLTYGLNEACGYHDWKNSAVAGAITGMTLALTTDDTTHEQVVQSAITGAAIATAANMLTGIF